MNVEVFGCYCDPLHKLLNCFCFPFSDISSLITGLISLFLGFFIYFEPIQRTESPHPQINTSLSPGPQITPNTFPLASLNTQESRFHGA